MGRGFAGKMPNWRGPAGGRNSHPALGALMGAWARLPGKEIHRMCVNGALVTVITPHFSSLASWRDPTHLHHLSFFSMDHFEKSSAAHYTAVVTAFNDLKGPEGT